MQDSLFIIKGDVIDLTLSAKRVAADEDLAKELIAMMLTHYEEEKAGLDAAFQAKDWDTASYIVHKLRGGIAYCGTPRLQTAINRLEDYLDSGQTELADKLYAQFTHELDLVKKHQQ